MVPLATSHRRHPESALPKSDDKFSSPATPGVRSTRNIHTNRGFGNKLSQGIPTTTKRRPSKTERFFDRPYHYFLEKKKNKNKEKTRYLLSALASFHSKGPERPPCLGAGRDPGQQGGLWWALVPAKNARLGPQPEARETPVISKLSLWDMDPVFFLGGGLLLFFFGGGGGRLYK